MEKRSPIKNPPIRSPRKSTDESIDSVLGEELIPAEDDQGRVVDFHGLRHTFISNLAAGGVHPKTAQALARHSTITLTMDRYTHLTAAVVLAGGYFMARRWDYNALDAGDETAQGLGVPVGRVRLMGMLVATLVTAVIVAFLGVIGFVGLVCPHIVRRVIGDDHRFLLPGSALAGVVLLLASSTAARLMLAPRVLPVSLLTAFLGAPAFLYLIVRRRRA